MLEVRTIQGGSIKHTSSGSTYTIDQLKLRPVVVSANQTAIIGDTYHNVASVTYTDPSPEEGKGFTVLVRNGTATVGGVAYSTAGTVIERIYHSGAWANYSYEVAGGGAFLPLAGGTLTGEVISTKNGAASTTALKISGVPFAGTGTTSFPLVYINDANATASTTLNTAGTYLGVNGDGTQDLMNLMQDGVSQFKVGSTGITALDRIHINGGIYFGAGGGSPNVYVSLSDPAAIGPVIGAIGSLYFTTTAAWTITGTQPPKTANISQISSGLLGIGTGATGSTAGSLSLTNLTASGTVKLGAYTVATLPTPATGMTCYVTDANATTFASTVAGGGANVVPVFYNGTNWIIA